MDKNLKIKLLEILNDLPSENSCIDYKVNESYVGNMAEYLKDLCAFLNSNDGYGKDKFIIMGISETQRKIMGIPGKKLRQDDSQYQHFADMISPRPNVETGVIKYSVDNGDVYVGYIYISKNNKDRVYSINTNYPPPPPPQTLTAQDEHINSRVYASTAWIRRGSVNEVMTEEERRKIYNYDKEKRINKNELISTPYYDLTKISEEDKIIKMVTLLGSWDENNENDKVLVSELVGRPYDEWISKLRLLLKQDDSPFKFSNGKWQVINKYEMLKENANNYFDENITQFQSKVIEVLSQRHPKFDLEPDKRFSSNIYGKNSKYSQILTESISETLPMIRSIVGNFVNCNNIKYMPFKVVREVLKSDNWEVWASLDNILPILAEADPEEFMVQLDDKIINHPQMIKQLVEAKEDVITTKNYTTGLYWALELIAWDSRNLVNACMLFLKMSKYDIKAINHIVTIILPWGPQTKATIDNRKTVVETAIKEEKDLGWKLILDLMPKTSAVSTPSYKPRWNDIIEEDLSVTMKEYWEQISNYIDIAIKYSKTDINKLCDLIKLLDDVTKEMFDKIMKKLSSKNIINLKEEKRYEIWNQLEDLIVKHKKFSTAEWALPKEAIDAIKALSKKLKPSSRLLYDKRIFRNDSWNLLEEKGNYEEEEQKLYNRQLLSVKAIISKGLTNIITFAGAVENSNVVGTCLAELVKESKTEQSILEYLDSENSQLVSMARGFVRKKFILYGYEWIDNIDLKKWNDTKRINLLIELPNAKKTWDLVLKYLSTNQDKYWKVANIRFIEKDSDINYPIKKLLDNERPDVVIDIISMAIYKKVDYDKKNAVEALKKMLGNQGKINNINYYNIKEIIKDLQKSNIEIKDLFDIEWAYLSLLNEDDDRPITLEKEMARNPVVFNEFLCLAYRAHNEKRKEITLEQEKIAINAHKLLQIWKYPPGLTDDDSINKKALNDWYKKMRKICKESDRLEIALNVFGKVLYHSPTDKNGLWIDKNVASLLNEEDSETIREGYRVEAFNSLGVVSIDREGKIWSDLANKYEKQAEAIEKEGFFRFAMKLRQLSDEYKNYGEKERKGIDD